MTAGVLAVLVVTLPHGTTPEFGVGRRAGGDASHPYAAEWHTVHAVYSAALTMLVCGVLVISTARAELPSQKLVVASAVVSTAIVALQMCGTYLAYRSTLDDRRETGVGLWLSTPLVVLLGAA